LWPKSSGDDGEQEWTAVTVMTARIGEDWMVAIVMQITTTQLDWIVSHSHCAVRRKKTPKRKRKRWRLEASDGVPKGSLPALRSLPSFFYIATGSLGLLSISFFYS
jgi:hypothetical protein